MEVKVTQQKVTRSAQRSSQHDTRAQNTAVVVIVQHINERKKKRKSRNGLESKNKEKRIALHRAPLHFFSLSVALQNSVCMYIFILFYLQERKD